mgnify:CR=1 FL=1
MQIIDGYGGRPHIEAFEVRELNASLHGPGDYVADIGDRMGCEVVTNNKIQVKSGAVLVQGCRGINPVGSIVDMIIENGRTGDNRNDLIVVRYSKDPVSSEEKMELAVVKGTAVTGGAASDPKIVTGSLRDGDTLHEMPLYRVALQGLNIVKVTPLFQTIRSTEQLSGLLDDVNGKVGPLSSLATGAKASIVGAINWLKTQVDGKVGTSGNASNVTNAFAQASSRAGLASGEKLSTSLGKISKWLADLGTAAFCTVANNLAVTAAGYVLDARQGKALSDKIAQLRSDIAGNLNANQITLETSTYYPPTVVARSGQSVYIKCAGYARKDIGAGGLFTIAAAGALPEECRPVADALIMAPIAVDGRIVEVSVKADGSMKFSSSTALEAGFPINLNVTYMTRKSNF